MAAKPQPQKQPAAPQPVQPSPTLAKPPEKHNRTAFVREYLKKNPDAKLPEIVLAWTAQGKPPELAPTQAVLNNVNVERRKQAQGQETPRARLERGGRATGGQDQESTLSIDWLIRLEDQLDDAVFKAKQEKNDPDWQWLRNLRRHVTYKIALRGGLEDLVQTRT
jgi:hypothetical protein